MAETRAFKIYSKLPVFCQNIACSLAGLKMRRQRYGKCFREFLRFLDQSQWWPYEKQLEYQNEQLRKIIDHAYASVPYYRRVMDERHLTPSDIRTVEDLPKLPILTKDDVRHHCADLISTALSKDQIVQSKTGGTTGKALKLFQDKETIQRQWAVWWRHRQRFGLGLGDEFIAFAGRDVVSLDSLKPPFWRRNRPMHQTYVSLHHMTEENMPALVDYLSRRKVKYYSGYPSGVYLLAHYLVENNITLPHPPKVVTTGAETLLEHQKEMMARAFPGAIVTDQYGASENCGNISECEEHRYHVDMEFGAIELLPLSDDLPNLRKIICTGFWNMAMPLIRYDIGDIATVPEGETACPCGRKSPIVTKIDGRIESYIITPDGRQMGRLDFIFKETHAIEEAQLVQDCLEKVIVKVVANQNYSEEEEKRLLSGLHKYLGDVIEFEIEYVDTIPRAANGKFRQIVSNVFKERHA